MSTQPDAIPAHLNISFKDSDLFISSSNFIQFIFTDDNNNPLEHTIITKNELFSILSRRTRRIDASTPD